ncbi:hypothetical protein BO78DRAFT_403072 [Aspergillus sclerotiicarbonarius CBS 121057]|uniref:Aminoglycoside phosphotransferase domain-containing protein n=1 Tax=Aspergillus sclerotiicarbonarius (strain CBS 121057 / IBT 28362) TaxID=1448318 RepID=A0A319EN55_ASPSB|nr:hypothetical protein BO78DRAFT_403072 [Aspergillus sclerotiicarbonarius CBS 121057]
MSDTAPALSLASPEAAQWNKDLIQAFQAALEKDPAQSYAGKINLQTLNELHDNLTPDPEINLLSIFPKNYTRRITMATGPRIILPQETSEIQGPPEFRTRLDLAHTATIVFPLSGKVTALLEPYPKEDNSLTRSLKHLLWNSPRVWEDPSRGIVVKCSDHIIAKVVTGNKDYTEYTSIQYLAEYMADIIPVPEPHGLIAFEPFRVIFMEFIPGVTLARAWPDMTHDEKRGVQSQLDTIFRRLRNVQPRDGISLGGVAGEGVKELRVDECSSFKGIMTATEFSNLQFSARHYGSTTYVKLLCSLLGQDSSSLDQALVFTHGDIRPDNIIVKQDTENDTNNSGYSISGVIDWEYSGFYPAYYESTALTRTMGVVEEDDWYLYLPDCISPSRFPVRWLVDRLWGIHLRTT